MARTGLLDALEALESHLDALVIVGAQAVYLHTGTTEIALAEFTTDGDVAIDPDPTEFRPTHRGSDARGGVHARPTQQRHRVLDLPAGRLR